MPKPVYKRLQLDYQTVLEYIELLEAIGMPFIMDVTNYTTRITSDNYNLYLLKTQQSNRVFAAGAMLKSQLKNKPLPGINIDDSVYYDTNFHGDVFYADSVFNIDIKSAYATILYQDGFINRKLYNYVCSLPKKDRLAAIGMLASRKATFKHNSVGAITSFSETINPLSPFFFYCVQKTENIIREVRNEFCKKDFLFSWVDGIYYGNPDDDYESVIRLWLRQQYGLESTFKELTNFDVQSKRRHYKISFNEGDEKKVFNIPFGESSFRKKLTNYLLTKDNKK